MSFDIGDIDIAFRNGGLVRRELFNDGGLVLVHIIVVDIDIELPEDVILEAGISGKADKGAVLDFGQGDIAV